MRALWLGFITSLALTAAIEVTIVACGVKAPTPSTDEKATIDRVTTAAYAAGGLACSWLTGDQITAALPGLTLAHQLAATNIDGAIAMLEAMVPGSPTNNDALSWVWDAIHSTAAIYGWGALYKPIVQGAIDGCYYRIGTNGGTARTGKGSPLRTGRSVQHRTA